MRHNRSRVEIMVDILSAINRDRSIGTTVTKLMKTVGTSYSAVSQYLKELKDADMVVFHSAEGKYAVTQKGRVLISKFGEVSKMLEIKDYEYEYK